MTKLKQKKDAGFTLIEILIIAPIVIIAISGFIALMVTIVGKVLLTRDQTAVTYDTQNALDRIEQDIKLSAKFLTTTGTLPSPQGSDNNYAGTAAFSNTSNTLILNMLATDSNPHSWDRWLMYYDNQPNPCGGTETSNRVFSVRVIYYIKNGTLWRRTYVPPWNLNTSAPDANTICTYSSSFYPWQKNTCNPGYTSSQCQAEDERVMDNVNSLNVQYFSDPGSTTDIGASNAASATAVNVTIASGKTTAGKAFTASSSLRASKLNSINTDASPVTTPVVSNVQPVPDQATFSWAGIPSATNYLFSYNINGGSWTNTTLSSSTTSYTISANRGDTISVKVAATNGTYTSGYGTNASTLPLWTDITLPSGWSNYTTSGSGYNTAQFTKTSACRVFLKGLIKNTSLTGAVPSGTIIGNLPVGFRPTGRLVFQVATSPNSAARIDVAANGDIAIMSGNYAWISLDTISFTPSSCTNSWNELPFYNGWTNWGYDATNGTYESVHAQMDNLGRISMQGLAKAGTTTANTDINKLGDVSSTYTPPASLILPAGGSGFSEFQVVGSTTGNVQKIGAQTSSYMGLQALFYPGTTGSWTTPTPVSPWVNYGGGWPTLQYTKASDGVVTVRGLVKSGATGAAIITLPAGYLPPARELLTVASADLFGRVDILTTGDIILQSGSNTWVELNFSFIPN
jgi:type II secretory pathway pseudopilin PulG